MKKLVLMLVIALSLGLYSCGSENQKDSPEQTEDKVFSISDFDNEAENYVGKEIKLKGIVDHVCSHSGRRLKLTDEKGEITIRVDATEELGNFDKEITGQIAIVTGIVKMEKYEGSQILAMEEAKNDELTEEEINSVHHQTELKEIIRAKKWMKDNNKDYYPNYALEGIAIETVTE